MLAGSRNTFPKSARLRKRPQFLSLSRSGRKVRSPNFIVVTELNECSESRLGVTVSAKVGNAVVRNRIKRIARECFRQRRHQLLPPRDILLIARAGAAALSRALLRREIEKSLDDSSRPRNGAWSNA